MSQVVSIQSRTDFLRSASSAAAAAGHIWPQFAACEAALESGWNQSRLAVEANNLFGQKQSHPQIAGTGSLSLPTREFLYGEWQIIPALWIVFPEWTSCFAARMALLKRLANKIESYSKALNAASGEEFITAVSRKWSTDPTRASKVLRIYSTHAMDFA